MTKYKRSTGNYFAHPKKGAKRITKHDRRSTTYRVKNLKKYNKAVRKGRPTNLYR